MKDTYRRTSLDSAMSNNGQSQKSWDGTRKSSNTDVVAELKKMSSSKGYGAAGM